MQRGYALQFASSKLRMDKAVVMKAITQHGCAFQFAASTLKRDEEVVVKAIMQTKDVLIYVLLPIQVPVTVS